MRRYELDERAIKISQALDPEERIEKKRLGYIKYAINKSTGIKLHWIKLNLDKRSISVYGQLAARVENNSFLKYFKYESVEDEVRNLNGQMVDKKLVATTVSSREIGMQRRINQVTTSSHVEKKNKNDEMKEETSRIHISFKRKDSRKLNFTRVKKENTKGEKESAAAGSGRHSATD